MDEGEIVEQGTFSIRVVDRNGSPLPKAKVLCRYEHNVANEMEYTDEVGRAVFPIYGSPGNNVAITSIMINDEDVSLDRCDPTIGSTHSFTV